MKTELAVSMLIITIPVVVWVISELLGVVGLGMLTVFVFSIVFSVAWALLVLRRIRSGR